MTTATPTAATSSPAAAPAAPAAAPAATLLSAEPAAAPAAAAPAVEPAKPAEPAKPGEPAASDYTDFTLPDGVTFNPEALGEFKSLAKEKGLTQEEAQKFADIGAKITKANRDALETQTAEFYKDIGGLPDTWPEAARNDKEFGGDNLAPNLAIAKQALNAFDNNGELVNLLNKTKFGDHPAVIRAFVRIGKAMSEDKLVTGGKQPAPEPSMAQRMYPNMNP